ncbi:MAG: type II toxin-antitoxin system HicB family antitoxin [Balneolia bacterium]|nr:type II toxin-antitoxin system HicB family antitoxin [Balneolia bacterium]
MSTLSVRLPESVHRKLKEMAEKEGVSMNQLISLAVSEKLSSLMTVDYLNERARQANLSDFRKLLDKVPDSEPEPFDKL